MYSSSNGKPVMPERTGWRDQELSERHRLWGFNCPATDMDFCLVEYDSGKPFAIVEYKRATAAPVQRSAPTIRAIVELGNRAKLPVLLTTYTRDFTNWRVVGLNWYAERRLPKPRDFSEREYVDFLLAIRGRQPNGDLFGEH